MKIVAVLFFALSFPIAAQQTGEIFDLDGNLLYQTVETGDIQHVPQSDGRTFSYNRLRLLHVPSGRSYTYDHKWEVASSAGAKVVEYIFNKRSWKWLGETRIRRCVGKKGAIIDCTPGAQPARRYYAIWDGVMTVRDEGERPILTYDDGLYLNEFGETVYRQEGTTPKWVKAILLHQYYEANYHPAAMAEVTRRRGEGALQALESNSLAEDMLALARHYHATQTTFMGTPLEMLFFTRVNGKVDYLTGEQVLRLKNKWLEVNEKTRRRSRPFDIPAGGFYVKKKEAKKLGIPYTKSRYILIEIKVKPTFKEAALAALAA